MNMAKGFPIPSALHDLERDPYNLLPYPETFDDDDEAARAESFDALVLLIESSNRTAANSSMVLFESDGDDEEPWNNEDRMQALYTLVRYVCLQNQKFAIKPLVALADGFLQEIFVNPKPDKETPR